MNETLPPTSSSSTAPRDQAGLLELDPELGEALPAEHVELAARHLGVRLARIPTGVWGPVPDAFGSEGGLGLLVVEGYLAREVEVAHRGAAELLGPGDILRPWQEDPPRDVFPSRITWRVLTPVTVAVLDRPFTARVGRFPEITSALLGRMTARTRRAAEQVVLAQFASVEHRVLLALWHLSERWGRVRGDGIVVPVPLTHKLLGLLVGARRPPTTAALGALTEQRRLERLPDGGYLLLGDPPHDLRLLRGRAGRDED